MSKQSQKLIPQLRFPEFTNEVEWRNKTLIDICNITNGKANAQDHIEEGQYPLFDRSEVIKASNEYLFNAEAVIIPGEGMRFIPKYYKGKFNLHQRAYALKDFLINGLFMYYSMLHNSSLLAQKAVQSTVLSLRLPILQTFPLQVPTNQEEQQKIASCLSSLDEVIKLHNQKLKLLKEHKKGLIQNLFPQEDKKLPKYRFPEFKNNGKWDIKTIEDITISQSSNIALNKLELKNSGYPVYGADGIIGFIDNFQHSEEYISIVKDGSGVGRLAKCQSNSSILGTLTSLKSKDNKKFSLSWIYYLLHTVNFSVYVKGAGIPHIYYSDYKNEKIPIPSPAEQQKIASCLSSLDEIIKLHNQKLEFLKEHKKGLMQNLFPKVS